nr:hypothetical protein [Nocardioides convexus]
MPGDPASVRALVGAIRQRRPRALVATDEEGGDVTRLHREDASPVPGPAVLGAADDLDLTAAVGRAVGAEPRRTASTWTSGRSPTSTATRTTR